MAMPRDWHDLHHFGATVDTMPAGVRFIYAVGDEYLYDDAALNDDHRPRAIYLLTQDAGQDSIRRYAAEQVMDVVRVEMNIGKQTPLDPFGLASLEEMRALMAKARPVRQVHWQQRVCDGTGDVSPFCTYRSLLLDDATSESNVLQGFVLSLYNGDQWPWSGDMLQHLDEVHFDVFVALARYYRRMGREDPHFLEVGRTLIRQRQDWEQMRQLDA